MEHSLRNGNRIAAAACISLLILSGLCILADSVSADDDSFVIEGVEYRVTNEDTVAVHYIDPDTVGNVLKINCFVSEPKTDKVYTVTAIDEDAFGDSETIVRLFLPTTLESIGKNAFKGLFDSQGEIIDEIILPGIRDGDDIYVPGVYGEADEPIVVPIKEYIPDLDSYREFNVRFIDEEKDGVQVRFLIGIDDLAELKATNIDIFENGYYTDTFYKGCVNCFERCYYERSYFECIGWSLETGASEPDYDAESDIAVDDSFEPTDFFAVWEETGYDYPVWMFKATTVIIILLAVIGVAIAVRNHLKARQA